MFRVQSSFREFRNDIEHRVGETADVENVGSFLCLRRSVWLDVQADEFRVSVAGFELIPFGHRVRAGIPRAV